MRHIKPRRGRMSRGLRRHHGPVRRQQRTPRTILAILALALVACAVVGALLARDYAKRTASPTRVVLVAPEGPIHGLLPGRTR